MSKLLLGLILMSLAAACGDGFEKNKPKKQSKPDAIEVDTRTITEEYLDLLNDHRVKLGLRPLVYHEIIETIARGHSKGMALYTRPFGHMGFSLRCRQLKRRIGRHTLCGEVVAMGQKTPKDVFKAWMNSPKHRIELENPRFTMTGMGFYKDSRGLIYWTQMFIEL